MSVRTLVELMEVDLPAWPRIHEAIAASTCPVEVVSVEETAGTATLLSLQVTAASALGALALETGGLLVDHRWLRVLGGGADLIRQGLAAGVVDELAISTAPVVLGAGKRLFEGFDRDLDLEITGTWSSPYATHVRYALR